MRIAILNYEDAVPTCVTGPADIWYGLHRMYPVLTGKELKDPIEIDFISTTGKALFTTTFGGQKQRKLAPATVYDLVIIPAMRYEKVQMVLDREQTLIKWLQKQYTQGAERAII